MDNNDQENRKRFQGFRKPNYTMVPDELFDELLPELSGGEVKVLLYIIRRTFGFKRDSDTISLSQMLHGIKKRGTGEVLDRGAGLSKPSLLQALRGLQEKNVIFAERQMSEEKGNEPTRYYPNVQMTPLGKETYPPLVKKVDQGVGQETLPSPRSRKLTTQYTVEQKTVKQEIEFEHSNIRKVQPTVSSGQKASGGDFSTAGDVIASHSLAPKSLRKKAGSQPMEGKEQLPQGARAETETEEWQAIQAYIEGLMRQLGDRAPLKSSTTRAWNLFQAAGVPLPVFLNKLYQARALTQESSSSITGESVDAHGLKRKAKAAYFFAVLEDVLGLVSEEEKAKRLQFAEKPAKKPAAGSTKAQPRRQSDGPYGHLIEI